MELVFNRLDAVGIQLRDEADLLPIVGVQHIEVRIRHIKHTVTRVKGLNDRRHTRIGCLRFKVLICPQPIEDGTIIIGKGSPRDTSSRRDGCEIVMRPYSVETPYPHSPSCCNLIGVPDFGVEHEEGAPVGVEVACYGPDRLS